MQKLHPNRRVARSFLTTLLAFTVGIGAVIGATVLTPTARAATLVWSDEFTGSSGASPSTSKWNWETGGGGWGNNEWQTYTNSRSNSYLNGNGQLVIAARYNGTSLTSARMNTLGKFALTDGTLSARIKLPAGQGLLPAFWLVGTNINSVGWPRAGEIDVIETPNNGWRYNSNLHGPTNDGSHWQSPRSGPAPVDLTAGYHTYTLTKRQNRIDMNIDGQSVGNWTPSQLSADQQWVFNKPFYVLFTLAVGGNWPGDPDLTTPNPSYMLVDWIRAYSL